jgi:TonB family protein
LAAGCGALFMAFVTYMMANSPTTSARGFLVAFTAATTLFFLLQFWRLTKAQVVLFPDRLEKPGILRPSILHRDNIRGVGKTVYTRSGSYFEVASKSAAEPSVRLDAALRDDPVIAAWLSGAPDPKAEALKAARAEILADARYGASETERLRRLEWAKRWTTAFNIACLMLAAWVGFMAPLSASTLLAVVAPLIVAAALAQMSAGLVVWYGRPGRPRIIGALAPAAALAAHAGLAVHILRPDALVWVAALLGLGAAASRYAVPALGASRLGDAIATGVAAGLAVYGLGVALNVCLDGTAPRTFVSTVIGERISHGRSTAYYLELAPWSDQPTRDVTVSAGFYDSAPVGSRVCLVRRGGALGLGWFDVTHCAAAAVARSETETSDAPPSGLTQPDWATAPTGAELGQLYPDRAQRLGVEGAATVGCVVQLDGSLTDCQVISEAPQGYGFGAAAVKAAGRFRMRPATRDGEPVVGRVAIPLKWRLH